jgi:branched-chain amino acid transport system permease protein
MQVPANILVAASAILLMAVGFVLAFNVTRFFHFAHGILFTAGAYAAFALHRAGGLPLIVSMFLGVAVTAVLGVLTELAVYRPLRGRGASAMVLLLASLGVYILLQNAISMAFGDKTQTLRSADVGQGIVICGAKMTCVQFATIGVTLVLLIAVALLLSRTKVGRAMKAVANDSQLAAVSGIESNRVILWTFALGSALAGAAGILVALDLDMTPTMGMNALMLGVVAVIVGGVKSSPGIACGALLLAVAQQMAIWTLGSVWQDSVAFVVLLAFLVVWPEGFLGRRAKGIKV